MIEFNQIEFLNSTVYSEVSDHEQTVDGEPQEFKLTVQPCEPQQVVKTRETDSYQTTC